MLSGSHPEVLPCGGSRTGRTGGSAPAECFLEVPLRCCLAMVQGSTQSVGFLGQDTSQGQSTHEATQDSTLIIRSLISQWKNI